MKPHIINVNTGYDCFAFLRNRHISSRHWRPVWCIQGNRTQLHSTCVECHCEPSSELRGIRRRAWHYKTKQQFYSMAGFPNVIGCIDCTHVKVIAPSRNEYEYVNRKGYHSINVQLICDADLKILNCVVKSVARVRPRRTDCSGERGFPCVRSSSTTPRWLPSGRWWLHDDELMLNVLRCQTY